MSRKSAVLATLLALAAITACGEEPAGPKPPPVLEVEVEPEEVTLAIGSDAKLEADVELGSAQDSSVTWTSTSDSVVTVDSTGIVTGIAEGTATVVAAADAAPSVRDSASVTVRDVQPLSSASTSP